MLWLVELMFFMQTLQVSELVVVAACEMAGTAGRPGSVVTHLFPQSCFSSPPPGSTFKCRSSQDPKFLSFTHHRGEWPGLWNRDEALAWGIEDLASPGPLNN